MLENRLPELWMPFPVREDMVTTGGTQPSGLAGKR